MRPKLITRLKEEWNNLDPVDPLRGLISDAIDALTQTSKPFVGLTDEDFNTDMFSIRSLGACDIPTIKSIARDVEAKLREKNA